MKRGLSSFISVAILGVFIFTESVPHMPDDGRDRAAADMVGLDVTRLDKRMRVLSARQRPDPTVSPQPTRTSTPRPSRSRRPKAEHRSGGWHTTRASWYDVRPAGCYDDRGFHPHPSGLRLWTAHKTLPCGTIVVVRYGGAEIDVQVRDRGPYSPGRDLDLSLAAFKRLASSSRGVIRVEWRVK